MKFRNIIFSLLILFIILSSINFIFAEDYTNESSVTSLVNENNVVLSEEDSFNANEDNLIDNMEVLSSDNNGEVLSSEGNVYIAYVDQNSTENGDGSPENPFVNLTLACAGANIEHRNNVIINIKEGNYYLGGDLIFDTDNLVIQGEGNVVIKNQYDHKIVGGTESQLYGESFGLTSSSSNFTISNINFKSNRTNDAMDVDMGARYPNRPQFQGVLRKSYFYPFYGNASMGIFNNCSFDGFKGKNRLCVLNYNSTFINCLFSVSDSLFVGTIPSNVDYIFKYCVFNIKNAAQYITTDMAIPSTSSFLMDGVWFGQEGLPQYLGTLKVYAYSGGPIDHDYIIPVTRYAIFNVTQNYLGNDEYEIIGKLTWNGTDGQDGMENFQPMTVTLLSENGGEIVSTVPLVNGTFKTTYKNPASNHKITATLHNQDIDLEFITVNITANEASIKYGEDQNITVNLSQAIDNNVTITVSNATYNKTYVVKVNGTDSFTFTIPDRLKAGTYNVNITLNNGTLFGFNTTTLTVSKVSDYKFEVIPSSNVKVGDTATITITLPDDVNGTVTVKFGNEAQKVYLLKG